MNKTPPLAVILLIITGSAIAAQTKVHHDKIVSVANGKLSVLNFDGTDAACEYNELSSKVPITIDVAENNETVIATTSFRNNAHEEIDISDCFDQELAEIQDCVAKVDLEEGIFQVPCIAVVNDVSIDHLNYDDENDNFILYQAFFKRLGKSLNWKVDNASISELDLRNKRKNGRPEP